MKILKGNVFIYINPYGPCDGVFSGKILNKAVKYKK